MSSLDSKIPYLWHAYNSLKKGSDTGVPRTQIKVLTQNISTSIGLIDVEKAWDNPGTPNSVTFQHFITYLERELLGKLKDRHVTDDGDYFNFNHINDVCWMLCSSNYPHLHTLKSADHFRLWCIFNNFSELEPSAIGYTSLTDDTADQDLCSSSSMVNISDDARIKARKDSDISDAEDEHAKRRLTKDDTVVDDRDDADDKGKHDEMEECLFQAQRDLFTTSVASIDIALPSDKLKRGTLNNESKCVSSPNKDNTLLFSRPIECSHTIPIRIHTDEVRLVLKKLLCFAVGNSTSLDNDSTSNRGSYVDQNDNYLLSFSDFISMIEKDFINSVSPDEIESAILALYEESVLDIIKKGYLQKKGPLGTWKSRWFTVTPSRIAWHQGLHNEKGNVKICNVVKIEPSGNDKANSRQLRFQLVTELKTYELSTIDTRNRSEWISAIRMCIENKELNVRMKENKLRQRKRREQSDRNKIKMFNQLRLNEENQQTKLLLLEERKARRDAESKLLNESALLEDERKRLDRLDSMNQELEQLLSLERQAKEDEEIVRAVQSRMLKEEFKKSEELETLKCKMSENLESERQKRQGAENDHKDLQEKLEHERSKLEKMSLQRSVVDKQLKKALDKLEMAEKSKEDLKNKMNKQMSYQVVHSHRGIGAFPKYQ